MQINKIAVIVQTKILQHFIDYSMSCVWPDSMKKKYSIFSSLFRSLEGEGSKGYDGKGEEREQKIIIPSPYLDILKIK